MEHFINLVDILVWPSTVIFILYMLRKPIQLLIPYIENFKYKDVEVTFRKGLEQAKEEFGANNLPTPIETDETSSIYKLIEVSPASAIIESWKLLETAAVEKVIELEPSKKTQEWYKKNPFNYLEYSGALIPTTASAIRDLTNLRNQAAHSGSADISKGDAVDYASLSLAITNKINAITELPKIQLTALTLLILQLNSLIDSGKFNDISIDEIYEVIESKNIIPFLKERTSGHSDFSLFYSGGPYDKFSEFYHEQMESLYHGYAGDHRRKWGVEKLGLCLLLAWTNELIQLGSGWYPDEM